MAFVFWLMMQIAPFLRGQSVLNVTDYGAVGDAVQFSVSTVAGSPVVTANGTNTFTSADIGKVIEVFRAGPQVYYNGNLIVTQQDIICTVQDVSSDGTSLTLSIPCGYTLPNAYCIVGTDNVNAFQNVINLASGMVNSSTTNVTIEIPSGTYLLINAEALDTNFVMSSISETEPALTISSGGLTLQGEPGTVLMGCGAGMNHYVNPANMYPPGAAPIVPYRGNLFFVAAPSANPKYPLVFNNLVLDGGLLNGLQAYQYWTINQPNGDGWDMTHDALFWIDTSGTGQAQMVQTTVFTNCVIQHWRGEMLKGAGITGGTNTFIDIANCVFDDGNASAINPDFAHHIHGCRFSNLVKVFEWYESRAQSPSVFEFNTWSNIYGTEIYTIVGSIKGQKQQPTLIYSNYLVGANNYQIGFAPAENVTIASNIFVGSTVNIALLGTGMQPTDGTASNISNIVVSCNNFLSGIALYMENIPIENILVTNNAGVYAMVVGGDHANGSGGYKTNILFGGNTGAFLDSRNVGSGSYFVDQTNNSFISYWGDTGNSTVSNLVSYGLGRLHTIQNSGASFYLDSSNPQLIPAGAILELTNSTGGTAIIWDLSTNLTSTGTNYTIAPGTNMLFHWNGKAWQQPVPTVKKTKLSLRQRLYRHPYGYRRWVVAK